MSAATACAQAEELKLGGTGSALGTMHLLAQAYAKTKPDTSIVVLPSMGSGGGIKALLAGAIQIGVSSRPLSAAESKAGAVATEYGCTPFVFATAASNAVGGITTRNLIDFYSGTVNSWPDGSKLRLVLRPIGDSDSETIKNISPAMAVTSWCATARSARRCRRRPTSRPKSSTRRSARRRRCGDSRNTACENCWSVFRSNCATSTQRFSPSMASSSPSPSTFSTAP